VSKATSHKIVVARPRPNQIVFFFKKLLDLGYHPQNKFFIKDLLDFLKNENFCSKF